MPCTSVYCLLLGSCVVHAAAVLTETIKIHHAAGALCTISCATNTRTVSPHTPFVCSVCFSLQTVIISLNSTNCYVIRTKKIHTFDVIMSLVSIEYGEYGCERRRHSVTGSLTSLRDISIPGRHVTRCYSNETIWQRWGDSYN
jgi:hypothetical protein